MWRGFHDFPGRYPHHNPTHESMCEACALLSEKNNSARHGPRADAVVTTVLP